MPKIEKTVPTTASKTRTTDTRTQTYKSSTTSGSFFDRATRVEELPMSGLKFLIFGMSGTGKTSLACDFPKPLLLIRPEEIEDGSLSVRSVKGVSVTDPLTDPDQLVEICEGQSETGRYKTIVLDGVSRLQDLVVKKHMGLADTPVQMTWGLVPQADWNRIGITVKDCLRELMRLAVIGTNIVVVGGERDYGEEAVSEVMVPKVMVALTPALTGWLHEVMDYNVHTFKRRARVTKTNEIGGKKVVQEMETNRAEFCVHVSPHPLFATKFRGPKGRVLPEVVNVTGLKDGKSYEILSKLIEFGDVTRADAQDVTPGKPGE